MFQVTFQQEAGGETRAFAHGNELLLDVARRHNIAIDAPCSGNGSCGKCRVRLLRGQLDSPRTRHISDSDYALGWRLACNSRVIQDVTVMVPEAASAYKSRIRTADLSAGEEALRLRDQLRCLEQAGIALENRFRAFEVTMDEPTLDDTLPDNERLTNALMAASGATEVRISCLAMRRLPSTLREGRFHVRCTGVMKDGVYSVMNVMPARRKASMCGLAIDIGTTTVSAVLFDLESGAPLSKASAGNGQIRYGADVINRIIEASKPGGKQRLRDAIVEETLRPMIEQLKREAGIEDGDILSVCVAGNTTMNHLFVGADAEAIRMEPYIPAFFAWDGLRAGEAGLPVHPEAEVILAPNIGSYVGGDITAGALMSMIWDLDALSLFIDLGTNGEIVFGNRDFMMSCACSAGPAFEGGDISCGMRATDGAIEACAIDRETMEPEYRVIGEAGQRPVGLCGSGIIDVISALFAAGIIDPRGRFIREGSRVRHDANGFDCYVLCEAGDSATGREITINSVDIDNFIRAKAAIFSAIRTMLGALDMDIGAIENVYVAGGIGSGINMKNAVAIGMLPDIAPECFHYIGNTSLAGAYAMALSDAARDRVFELSRNMTYMELSTTPGYMDEFVAACFLPHTDAALFPSSGV